MATTTQRRKSAYDLTKPQFLKPQNRMEANLFLDKAHYGPSTALVNIAASTKDSLVFIGTDEADKVISTGYGPWIDRELSDNTDIRLMRSTNYHRLKLNADEAGSNFGGGAGFGAINSWVNNGNIYGKSKLRFKTTIALSQIFAMRDSNEIRAGSYVQSLFDSTLSTNTSSFRKLMKEVVYSPAMGIWLTYNGNLKADPTINRFPDENMARENMQLFSTGLFSTDDEGNLLRTPDGEPIEVYNALDVKECAKFYTGLYEFSTPYFNATSANIDSSLRWMYNNTDNHEKASKKLFAYPGGTETILPAQIESVGIDHFMKESGYAITVVNPDSFTVQLEFPSMVAQTAKPLRYRLVNNILAPFVDGTVTYALDGTVATINKTAHGLATGTIIFAKNCVEESMDAMLDHLFNHPSTPAFISKALIKFFVTSNPTPAYVGRVAAKFKNNGNGVRGDISAVVKAILLDKESLVPYGKNPNNHGRRIPYYERLMKVLNAFRSDIYQTTLHDSTLGVYNYKFKEKSIIEQGTDQYYLQFRSHIQSYYGQQQPFQPPSVFNFYRPGYVPPSTILGTLNLTGPEFQIDNPDVQTLWMNMMCAAFNYRAVGGLFDSDSRGTANGRLDPRGGFEGRKGMDYTASVWTVTAVNTVSGSEYIEITAPVVATRDLNSFNRVSLFNRRTGLYTHQGQGNTTVFISGTTTNFAVVGANHVGRITMGAGPLAGFAVNDVLDMAPKSTFPFSGLAGTVLLDGGGVDRSREVIPFMTFMYRFANLLPNTPTVSTAEVDAAIDGIQNLVLSRPISPSLRQLMKDQAMLAVTLPARRSWQAAEFDNLIHNYINDYRQIRIRRMLAILTVSPEFTTQY